MNFISYEFLLFFPIVLFIYYILPQKNKTIWLILASLFFITYEEPRFAIWLLILTAVSFFFAIIIENESKRKKMIAICGVVLPIGTLIVFKYSNFCMEQINHLLALFHTDMQFSPKNILSPLGLSFYSLQAAGYIIDVYKGKIQSEKNFLKYLLYMTFFPKFTSGPIERAEHFLPQIDQPKHFSFDDFKEGFLMILWGFFLKLIIADRISLFVNKVYSDCNRFSGFYLLIAALLYSIQIYADFSGYSSIAIGCAKMMGFHFRDNFSAPYISTGPTIFWRNWHISLTSWFRDYLYIPLGGNRKGKIKKIANQIIVFFASGLWHGADLTFFIWGILNGFFLVFEEISEPVRNKIVSFLHLHRDSLGHKILCGIFTFIIVSFSWIFFRANDYHHALLIIKRMLLFDNPWIFFDGSLFNCGLGRNDFFILFIGILILFFSDHCIRKGIYIRKIILRQDFWFRFVVIALFIVFIYIFGTWGFEYNPDSFIYMNF